MSSEGVLPSNESILDTIVLRLANLRGLDPKTIDIRERFSRYGLDSQGAISLLADLAQKLKRPLSSTLIWEQPTPESLASYLSHPQAGKEATPTADLGSGSAPGEEPIAMIGMACRFPMAPNPQSFWRLLCNGVDAITEAPRGRWDAEALFERDLLVPGKMNTRWGGFLEDIDQFDPSFFGISPREAIQMDPQQRLMLELSCEALEDAGLIANRIRGSRTGVFFGLVWNDYGMLVHQGGPRAMTPHTVTGFHHSIAANRVSYVLGLQGPSLAIDTACSSSLVAVHLGCESLRRGESTMVLAGGVNLNIIPESTIGVSKWGGLSPDGRCFTFDARANGYVRGEGGGVVVLKPLSRALADGDPIYCVIRGSAVNSDGASNGLTAPNPLAQEAVLRAAYKQAGIAPHTVDYVEAHGTGTLLGDPIEAKALGAVLGPGRLPERPLLLGSVKTNIGHLEGAAGVAGLIKAALSVAHRRIPPSLHFDTPNPHIPFSELNLKVQRTLKAWPDTHAPATAGVSAFGFGGTNCHVVVQEVSAPSTELFALSADSPEYLRAAAQALLAEAASVMEQTPLRSWCRSVTAHAGGRRHRLAAAVRSYGELRQQLIGYLAGQERPGLSARQIDPRQKPRPVFVFSGQGSQWAGMGRSLLRQEPAFRATIEQCDELIQELLGWSLLDELTAEKKKSRLGEIDVSIPAIVSLEMALADLWRSWGIEPVLVVGHSIGEISAAYVAGVLSLEDAMRVIGTQGRFIRRISGRGTMGLAALSWEDADRALTGFQGRLSRAIHEGPSSTVFSGETEALQELFFTLEQRGTFCRQINVDVAAHSFQLDGLREELFTALRGVTPRKAVIPISSSVTGGLLAGERFDAHHWVANLADPVLFAEAVSASLPSSNALFLEISPHPLLKRAIEACAAQAGGEAGFFPSLRRDEDERTVLLDTLGNLYTLGLPVRWNGLYPAEFSETPIPSLDLSGPVPLAGSLANPMEVAADRPACHVLPLSAHSEEALRALAGAYLRLVPRLSPDGPIGLDELAFSSSVRRSQHKHRLGVVCTGPNELREALEAFRDGRPHSALLRGRVGLGQRPKIVFIFPGQGSQWVGMGRELFAAEATFRTALETCDRAIKREAGFSIIESLLGTDGSAPLEAIDVIQPVLFAIEVALAAQWRRWGVIPDAVVGHSMGEVAAAYVAGLLSLEDAVRIICGRSRLLRRVSGKGAMVLVELSTQEAAAALAGYEDRVSVAVSNGPRSTVIAGEPAALDEVVKRLEQRGCFCRRVKIDVASHSPQMDPLLDELRAILKDLTPTAVQSSTRILMYSTVLNRQVDSSELGTEYWLQNLRAPVLFSSVMQELVGSNYLLHVEMSPHPVLLPAIVEAFRHSQREATAIPSLRRGQPERRVMLESLATLFANGYDVEWARLYPHGGRRVPLPPYPWQKQRYWIEPSETTREPSQPSRRQHAGRALHPLLGTHLLSSVHPGVHFWEQELSAAELPYLLEHRYQGQAMLTGAAYIEMALSASAEAFGVGTVTLSQIDFQRMFIVSAVAAQTIQVVLTKQDSNQGSIQIASRADSAWVVNASGKLYWEPASPTATAPAETPPQIQRRCKRWMSGSELYRQLADAGLSLGASFKGVVQLWMSEQEVLGQIRLPDEVAKQASAYQTHPVLLDASVQVMAGLACSVATTVGKSSLLLTRVESLRFHRQPQGKMWVHGHKRPANASGAGEVIADFVLWSDDGALSIEVCGLHIRRIADQSLLPNESYKDWLYAIEWLKMERAERKQEARPGPAKTPAEARGTWLVLSDRSGTATKLCALLQERGYRCVQAVAGDRAGDRYRQLGPNLFQLVVQDPNSFLRLLREAFPNDSLPEGVVHLWSLDATDAKNLTEGLLERDQRRVALSALYLAQALLMKGWRHMPPVSLVTRGAHAVGAPGAAIAVSQAPLWGLGRTLALEHPELRCVRIDLSPKASGDDAAALVEELLQRDGECDIALREDGRHVARLRRQKLLGQAAESGESGPERPASIGPASGAALAAVAADGVYLITGGRHFIGLAVAEWLAKKGARHLLLVDREGGSLANSPPFAALQQAGVSLSFLQADLGQQSEVARVLDTIDSRALPLRGIFHVEEIVDDSSLLSLDAKRLSRVMAAKAHGAWNLHALTLERDLDWFVLCSSHASLLGSPSQAHYAAASAFLDALAQHRRASGRCGLSINWGSFQAEDRATPFAVTNQLSYRGIDPMTPAQGMEILSRLLGQDFPQLGVLRLNLRRWIEFYPTAANSPLLSELRRGGAAVKQGSTEAVQFREFLLKAREEDRQELLERHICEQLGLTLHQDAARISRLEPLRNLGLDSMMALEVRNRLELSLNLELSASLLFTYAHITALAQHTLSLLGLAVGPVEIGPQAGSSSEAWEKMELAVAEMSDDTVEKLLLESSELID